MDLRNTPTPESPDTAFVPHLKLLGVEVGHHLGKEHHHDHGADHDDGHRALEHPADLHFLPLLEVIPRPFTTDAIRTREKTRHGRDQEPK